MYVVWTCAVLTSFGKLSVPLPESTGQAVTKATTAGAGDGAFHEDSSRYLKLEELFIFSHPACVLETRHFVTSRVTVRTQSILLILFPFVSLQGTPTYSPLSILSYAPASLPIHPKAVRGVLAWTFFASLNLLNIKKKKSQSVSACHEHKQWLQFAVFLQTIHSSDSVLYLCIFFFISSRSIG